MRRLATRIALVLGILVVLATPAVAPGPARAAGRPAAHPSTVSRTVAVDARALISEGAAERAALAVRAGTLRASAPALTRPTTVCSPIWFTAVGLTWRQRSGAHVHAELAAGPSSQAVEVASDPAEAPGPSTPDYDPNGRGTGLLWTGGARCVRFTLELERGADVAGLEAVFLNTSGTSAGPGSSAPAPAGRSGPGSLPDLGVGRRPGMVTRAEWGADPAYFNTGSPDCEAPYYADAVQVAYVHHTAGSNSYTAAQSDDIVRAIYAYHTQERGYCDIAYNFLVDRFGTIFVGRKGGVGRPVQPGSQAGFNPGTFSVSAMGNWDAGKPPAEVTTSIQRLIAWRLDVAHLPPQGTSTLVSEGGSTTRYPEGTAVTLPVITGHRDTGYTACPGAWLYGELPAIREEVAAMGGPKFFLPAVSAAQVTPGLDVVTFSATADDPLTWRVDVVASDGAIHATRTSFGTALQLEWDGTDGGGVPLQPGTYTAVIRASGSGGKAARPARFPVAVNPPAA